MALDTCPHCQRPVPAAANGVAAVVCASCGSEVRFEPELSRGCSLVPNRIAAPVQVVVWAKGAVDQSKRPAASLLHVLGAAYDRAAEFDAAEQLLLESMQRDPGWPGNAMTRPLLAMTYHHLGKAEQARHWLDETDRWLESTRQKLDAQPYGFPPGVYPADWLITQVLRREAADVLKAAP